MSLDSLRELCSSLSLSFFLSDVRFRGGVKLDVGDWRSRWYLHDGSCNLVRLRNGLLKKTSFIGRDFFF